jgi:hypothetical protein
MKRAISALAVLGAALALAGCGGGDESSVPTTTTSDTETTSNPGTTTGTETETAPAEAKPTVVRVTVSGGVPQGGIVRQAVDEGDRVLLVVASDVADEVHLHGYDLSRNVAPGKKARIAFRATIPGRFEVELEERGLQIAELTVNP